MTKHPLISSLIVPVTEFQQNCSILYCNKTLKAAVIDPGGDLDKIFKEITKYNLDIEKIFITHGHIDHAGSAGELSNQLNAPIFGPHVDDLFWINMMAEQGKMFGLSGAKPFKPEKWLQQDDTVSFGRVELGVLHCPGHTPGHIVFHHADSKLAIVGDVLFKGSIGRTDFPRGDHETLINSITKKLWPLGNETTFIPGHGPISSFGEERLDNTYVSDRVLGR